MKLDKYTQCSYFEIWSRRYHDNKVLLAAHKISDHNKIVFTKDKEMGTEPYYINGKKARQFRKENNGKIICVAVPIAELEPLFIENKDIRSLI